MGSGHFRYQIGKTCDGIWTHVPEEAWIQKDVREPLRPPGLPFCPGAKLFTPRGQTIASLGNHQRGFGATM
jgi:hypothetical protein